MLTKGTVLVADDDSAIRSVVRQALEAEGWRVLEAGDGAAALATYERERVAVELVLLDLTMPVMSGSQFAERYWGLDESAAFSGGTQRHAPVVVFTAAEGLEAAEQAERLRAVGFLTKPFELDDLVDLVTRCARPRPAATPGSTGEPEKVLSPGLSTTLAAGLATGLSASPSIVSRVSAKLSREEIARQQQIDRLRRDLARLQEDMGKVRSGVTQVSQIEAARRLTREEARWASQLRMESERLRHELHLIRSEFFRIKGEQPRRSN